MSVRGRGLMIAVDVKDQKTTERIHNKLIESGYIIGNRGSFLRIDPPLTIAKEELDQFIEDLGRIVRK